MLPLFLYFITTILFPLFFGGGHSVSIWSHSIRLRAAIVPMLYSSAPEETSVIYQLIHREYNELILWQGQCTWADKPQPVLTIDFKPEPTPTPPRTITRTALVFQTRVVTETMIMTTPTTTPFVTVVAASTESGASWMAILAFGLANIVAALVMVLVISSQVARLVAPALALAFAPAAIPVLILDPAENQEEVAAFDAFQDLAAALEGPAAAPAAAPVDLDDLRVAPVALAAALVALAAAPAVPVAPIDLDDLMVAPAELLVAPVLAEPLVAPAAVEVPIAPVVAENLAYLGIFDDAPQSEYAEHAALPFVLFCLDVHGGGSSEPYRAALLVNTVQRKAIILDVSTPARRYPSALPKRIMRTLFMVRLPNVRRAEVGKVAGGPEEATAALMSRVREILEIGGQAAWEVWGAACW